MQDDNYNKFMGLDKGTEVELAIFKRLFLGEDGQYVLGRILERCKFMEPCDNERDMALNNFAKDLMATIYWDGQKKAVDIHRVIGFIRNKLSLSRAKSRERACLERSRKE